MSMPVTPVTEPSCRHNQPLHILHLATTFPKSHDDAQPAFVKTLCHLLSKEARLVVLTPHARTLPVVEYVNGIELHRFRYAPEHLESLAYGSGIRENLRKNRLTFLLVPGFLLGMAYCLSRLMARSQFDVVRAHWWFPCGLIAALVARCQPKSRRPRILITCHGGDVFALHGRIFDFFLRLTARNVERFIAVSTAVHRNLTNRSIDASRISVIPMGVDVGKLFVPPAENQQRNGIVFVGRLVEKKGVDVLLHAVALLRDRGLVPQVTIAGDGPLRTDLEKMTSELGIREQIHFMGAVPNTDTPKLFQSASIAVFPFRRARSGDQDGLGLVMPEAMGCECLVVASDMENTHDVIINGQTGMVFPTEDATALADLLADLLSRKPETLDQMRHAAKRHATQNYGWQHVIESHLKIYFDVRLANGPDSELPQPN